MKIRYALVMLLLCVAAYAAYTPRELFLPKAADLQSFPGVIGQWRAVRNTLFDEPILKVLRPTGYLMRTYRNSAGDFAGLYVGYHDGGPDSGPIHSPRNCLPGAGWHLVNDKELSLTISDREISMVRAEFSKDNQGAVFYYWYQVADKTLTREFALKLAELRNMVFKRRKDASFIRLEIITLQPERSDALAEDFLQQIYPLLTHYIPVS